MKARLALGYAATLLLGPLGSVASAQQAAKQTGANFEPPKPRTQAATTTGLAAYWPLDESSGATAHDASGNGNNGTLQCSGCALPTWVAGERHGGLNFGGPNDVISVPDSPGLELTNHFTVAFWVNVTANATNITYLSKGGFANGYQVATGSPGNYIYFNLFNNNLTVGRCSANDVIQDQSWEHIAITYDGASVTFYLDGAIVGTPCSLTGMAGTSNAPLLIGGTNASSATGTMDEIRIYNRALTAQEVANLYNDTGFSVSVTPANLTLAPGTTQQYSAAVAGPADSAVTWSISPQVGTISPAGLYTAPALVNSAQPVPVTVTATSSTDPSETGSTTLALSPPVSVTPQGITMSTGQAQQFSASINGVPAAAVNWSISPQIGTISATGLYTAPASLSSTQPITVTATSQANNQIFGTAILNLQIQVLGTFTLSELFGPGQGFTGFPDQPIEFRYDGGQLAPGTARMILSNGTTSSEVPFQWVSSCSDTTATRGCIAVRSSLPAGSTYIWTLQAAAPTATPINPVTLIQPQTGANYYQITNGLTGIRLVAPPAGNTAGFNEAPIQGIQLSDGTWTGVGSSPNLLYAEPAARPGCIGCPLQTQISTETNYTVTVVDAGPMKTVIQATYLFNRPQYLIGLVPIPGSVAGQGHYTITMTMYANSKSVLIDEDTDMQFSYYIPLYARLTPDTARLRAHDSVGSSGNPNLQSMDIPACGYDPPGAVTNVTAGSPIVITSPVNISNGQVVLIAGAQGIAAANGNFFAKTAGYPAGQFGLYLDFNLTQAVTGAGAYSGGGVVKPAYRGTNISPDTDGFLDLTYTLDRPAFYQCGDTTFSLPSYEKLTSGYPAASHSAAWYMEFYHSSGGSTAPVVGFYAGRASKEVNSATGGSMPGPYSSNHHWITGQQAAGIQIDTLLRGGSGVTTTSVHRNWGIFVSTQTDLLAPSLHQPIADEQNSLTGINLSRLYTYQLVYPDPPGGSRWEYLSTSSANQLISLVRNGTSVCGSVTCYYTLLRNSEGSVWGDAILDMWQGNSVASVQNALNSGIQLAQKIEQTLASGDNHYDGPIGYYQLGLSTSPETAVLNAIIMDGNTTAQQRTVAKAILALFGSIFWDNDWFPIDNSTGEGDGLANQIQQYLQYRAQGVAAAPGQPFLSSMTTTAATYPANDFSAYFSATGAASGSTHYQSAFFEPLILNYMNFSLDGTTSINGFQPPMADPRWVAYANWELSIQTPPEPRFGGSTNPQLGLPLRKGYSNGDGNTEADVRTGMLGTALEPVNPTLAGNLMWAWQASNSPTWVTEDAQFVTTIATIDPTIPAIRPQMGSINIPGYHSVERYNFGTANETALWFINGDFYSSQGHRHFDDGQVSIYAHAAPLAVDWNANLYYPSTSGRFSHNSIVYDAELPHLWSADNASVEDVQTLMVNATNTEFAAFANSTTSTATFALHSDGTVWTRTVRTMNFNPSYPIIYVTDSFSGLSAGTGKTMTWNLMADPSHPVSTPAGSITPTQRFSAGCQSVPGQLPSNGTPSALSSGLNHFNFTGFNWPKHATQGVNWDLFILSGDATQQFMIGSWGHGCQSTRQAAEYQTANSAPFQEVQDILRVHDTGSFVTMILPYQKTQTPTRTVTQQSCGTQIIQGTETTCFNNSAATYSKPGMQILTAYDGSSHAASGLVVTGGPQEVVMENGQIAWTINGAQSGVRSITLPGVWYVDTAVSISASTYSYNYTGGLQAAPVTIRFAQVPWPVRTNPAHNLDKTGGQADEESGR